MKDRAYARLIRGTTAMPRKRGQMLQLAIEGSPKYPVTTTLQLPADFLDILNEVCRATAIRKYELFIAAVYQFLKDRGLYDQDWSLEPYVTAVEALIANAKEADRIRSRGGVGRLAPGDEHSEDSEGLPEVPD